MNDDRVWDLIARHWADQLAPGEEAKLHAWVSEEPARAEMLRGVHRILKMSRGLREVGETEIAWERVRGRIGRETSARYAPRLTHPMFDTTRARAGSTRVVARRLRGAGWIGIAATAMIAVGVAVQRWRAASAEPTPAREWVTRRGERIAIELPDGSRAMLGPDTRLRLATADFTRERTLGLEGVAHFAVAHDPSRPFTVLAGATSARAVGTAFAVRAYPEDATVQVVVSQGRVLFRSGRAGADGSTILAAGDAGHVGSAGSIAVEHGVDVDGYLSWMHGRIHYSAARVADVARDLERWYGVQIALDDSALARVRVTTSFDPAWPARDAVQRLAGLLSAESEQKGGVTHLYREHRDTMTMPSSPTSTLRREAEHP